MKVYTDLSQLPKFQNSVITIGTFDGVHFGHRKIIQQLVNEAKSIDGQSVIITFQPHPRLVLNPDDKSLRLLSTLPEKLKLLEKLDIDVVVVVPFTLEFAQQSAQEYVQDFLINHFQPHTIIIGYDHHFGKNREGNFLLLEKEKEKYHYHLIEIESQLINEISVSSTAIRNFIKNGEIAFANQLLEYDYSITGKVIKGNQLGRTLGFATANIEVGDSHKLIPQNGVYAVMVLVQNKMYNGMLNIGNKPTIDANLKTSIEVHILDFDQDIYEQEITVYFVQKTRDEQKFNGLEALKNQLSLDKNIIGNILK